MAATVAALVSARPVPPVRDESARAPKHPDTSQRKGLASSHFRVACIADEFLDAPTGLVFDPVGYG
jgi:hypothetical protein